MKHENWHLGPEYMLGAYRIWRDTSQSLTPRTLQFSYKERIQTLKRLISTSDKKYTNSAIERVRSSLWLTSNWMPLCFHRRRQWQPTPVLLPRNSHGWRSLVGCSPWGREELDTTERLHFHFSLSCTGEGNGNPLQCSCLENPKDGGAWWAAVHGVAQSQTQLKRLSSSSSSSSVFIGT